MSILRPRLLAYAAFLAIGTGAGHAAPATPERMRPMKVFLAKDDRPGCAPACAEWIVAQGKIALGSRLVFKTALRAIGSRRLPIFIDSPGGSVTDAMAIGRDIRARRLDVVITRTIVAPCGAAPCRGSAELPLAAHAHSFGATCASACVLILAAGEKRAATPWTLLGVHQIVTKRTLTRTRKLYRVVFRRENGVKVEISRTLISEKPVSSVQLTETPSAALYRSVADYLAAMGIGSGLMPLMLATPQPGIHWMTAAEEQATAIVTDRVDGEYVVAEAERTAGAATISGLPERASLSIAKADSPIPQVLSGRVVWSFDPTGAVLGSAVEVPNADLTVAVRLTVAPFPAAPAPAVPVLTVTFTPAPAGPIRSIEETAMPRMRGVDVVDLIGTVHAEGRDSVAFRLSDNPGWAATNRMAIETENWIDLPLIVNGKAATLTFEKGVSGTPLVRRAIEAATPAIPPAPNPVPAGAGP